MNKGIPILLSTGMQVFPIGIDAGNIPSDFRIRDWFMLAASVGYALYSFSENGIDGVLQSNSFFLKDETWYVGNLKYDGDEINGQDTTWYQNPHQTGDDIYLFGMFLYRILNEGKFPFTDMESFEGNALSRKDSKENIPLPSLGTDFMKELVCRIVNGQVQGKPDAIKKWLSDLYGMYEALRNSVEYSHWLDETLKSLDDRNVAGDDRKKFPSQDSPKVVYLKIIGVWKETQEEAQKPKEDIVKRTKKEKSEINKHKRTKKNKKRVANKKSYKEINRSLLRRVCIVLTICVCVMTGLTVWLQKMNYQQIYSYIDSGSYALALSEMQEKYNDGRNIDKVAEDYIESCCDNYEYKRVAQAITLLTDDYCQKHIEKIKEWAEAVISTDSGLATELEMALAKKNVTLSEME